MTAAGWYVYAVITIALVGYGLSEWRDRRHK